MSATETAPESEVVVISDDSTIAEGTQIKLRNAVKRSADAIRALPEFMDKTAQLFRTVAENRALARSFILLADNEPDWTGGSQTYKQEVNAAEADAFSSYSDSQKRSFDSNVRSHMRRGVLDKVIESWVRENRQGLKDAPKDSPKLKTEMRKQYARTETQPNPIKCPEHWLDTPPAGNGGGNGGAKDTPAQTVQAAIVALSELSGVERIGYVHQQATAIVVELTAPNAEVPGGRKRAADALLDLANLCKAGAVILGDANLSGEPLEQAQAAVAKYSYTA